VVSVVGAQHLLKLNLAVRELLGAEDDILAAGWLLLQGAVAEAHICVLIQHIHEHLFRHRLVTDAAIGHITASSAAPMA
jgi:hypothetical protein